MRDYSYHDIEQMMSERNIGGLEKLLEHGDSMVRLGAALALAELDTSLGWLYLREALLGSQDPENRAAAAAALGDLAPERAIPILKEALMKARGRAADEIKQIIASFDTPEGDQALREAGYEPVLPRLAGNLQLVDTGGEYVRSVHAGDEQVEFLTAEQHHDLAVELREAEMAERGLVENSLTLWLAPEWPYAWYLRGVLFEDLERPFEAALCYRWALDLDRYQADARSALEEIEAEQVFSPLEADLLLADLNSAHWQARRDAAAGLGELGEDAPEAAVERLIGLLDDDEREVRHAVIEALGNTGDARAVAPLAQAQEGSWLLRFAVIEALAQIGTVAGLADVLRREMDRVQERNQLFTSLRDPMLEVEYERLLEIGVLAFEKIGDLEGLIEQAENNAWVEVEEFEDEDFDDEGAVLEADEGDEGEDDLESYVDEVALMASLALERAALPLVSELSAAMLERLAAAPDLTLLDPAAEDDQPVAVHDLGRLREAARAELERRGD